MSFAVGDRVEIRDWHPDVPGHGMKWQAGTVMVAESEHLLVRADGQGHLTQCQIIAGTAPGVRRERRTA